MKKKEKWFIGILAVVAIIAIVLMKMPKKEPAVKVAIQHGDQIVMEFDPYKDAVYHIKGDYGMLDVEVKDGKWHVTNEQCPNHICSKMGWVGVDDLLPITCMPNNIIIYVEEQK